MSKKIVRITIDVELEKDVQDILTLAANRVHTIQGVANAFEVAVEDITNQATEIVESVNFMKDTPSWWQKLRSWLRGD